MLSSCREPVNRSKADVFPIQTANKLKIDNGRGNNLFGRSKIFEISLIRSDVDISSPSLIKYVPDEFPGCVIVASTAETSYRDTVSYGYCLFGLVAMAKLSHKFLTETKSYPLRLGRRPEEFGVLSVPLLCF